MAKLEVIFKCVCMEGEASAFVDERAAGEDIAVWMEKLQAVLGYWHRIISPGCQSTKMEYAKFQIPGTDEPGKLLGMRPKERS